MGLFGKTIRLVKLCGMVFLMFSLLAGAAEAKFINTFILRIGGDPLTAGDEVKLARHGIIMANKNHYDDIGSNAWNAIKSLNPNAEIYLYTDMNFVDKSTDSYPVMTLNNLGRYNVSRGHSMGSLNGDNPELFLKDAAGARLQGLLTGDYMLDFGNTLFQLYAGEALASDYAGQPWSANGVYSDHCFSIRTSFVAWPAKYDTNAKWSAAMNDMIESVSASLAKKGQKFGGNRGPTTSVDGYNAWLQLDAALNPPAMVLEEAAFAVGYGNGEIQFYSEPIWKMQVDLLSSIKNSKVCFLSSTDLLSETAVGTDNWGQSFTFWDALWFGMGSYLIGKNDVQNNSYFSFIKGTSTYNNLNIYYSEYDKIDLGKAMAHYNVTNYGGVNIYWREFEKGYVYVNPTYKNVASIPMLESCRRLTHATLGSDISALPTVSAISLNAHRTAIVLKTTYDTLPDPTNTVYEDAQDGNISGWDIYDGDPSGAAITNVYDSTRQSRIIQLSGSVTENGYRLRNSDGSLWDNSTQQTLRWSLKYTEPFTVYISVNTNYGHRYLIYTAVNTDSLGSSGSVHHGLGTSAIDGQWHTFTRDLQADLQDGQPGAQILSVDAFLIRGSGKLDDIQLLD